MPTATYVPLATLTLTSASNSITFSSIPGTYRDLVLVIRGATATGANPIWRANNDTGNNYRFVEAYGNGSTYNDDTAIGLNRGKFTNQNVSGGNQFNLIADFIDYSSSDRDKVVLSRVNSAAGLTTMSTGRYTSTTPISSIEIFLSLVNYSTGTTFSLYGIEA